MRIPTNKPKPKHNPTLYRKTAYFKKYKVLVSFTDVCSKCKTHHKYLIPNEKEMLCEYCFAGD